MAQALALEAALTALLRGPDSPHWARGELRRAIRAARVLVDTLRQIEGG